MADSLVLKGVKDVRRHSGTELTRVNPKRGGDTHQIRRWWTPGTVSTVYVTCTLFSCVQGGNTVFLAIDTQETSTIRIDVDANFAFSFSGVNGIKRAALLTQNMEVIEHYAFPAISGGSLMTVTPPGAPSRPGSGGGGGSSTSITSVAVSGDDSPTALTDASYSATVVGDATPYTYTWSTSNDTPIKTGQGTDSVTINWPSTGNRSVTCQVGSNNANFDGNTKSDVFDVAIGTGGGGGDPVITVTAPATFSGSTIDNKHYYDQNGCPGSNTIPAFAWAIDDDSDLSYWNLIMIDEDASDFVHWNVTNIPAATVSNTEGSEPSGGTVEDNDFGTNGYGGPCPPNGSGQHRYTVIVAAMDSSDDVIAQGVVTATITAATFSIAAAAAAADVTHVVSQAGGNYYIDGVANAEVTANAGETIYFDLSSATLSGHPFAIYTDSSKTTTVSVGIQTSDDGEILLFTPPIAGSFSYQCTQHANMGGDITIS